MIYNLQLLRALAALSVVYLHVVSDAGLNLGIGAGNFGVDLFFVISGFTMSYVGHMPAGQFVLRRLIRIVPLYWGATACAYAIVLIAPGKVQSASADLSHLVHSLLFLPYPNKLGQLLPTLALGWTLNYEMYFYALFSLALLFTIRWAPVVATAFLFIGGVAIRLTGTQSNVWLFYAKPIVLEFALGILVYYLVESKSVKKLVQVNAVGTKWLLMILALCSAVALPWQELSVRGERALYAGPPSFVLVTCAILLERQYGVTARKRWMTILGDASYVLYLIHPYVLYGLIRTFLNPSQMGPVADAIAVVMLTAAATAVAVAIHLVFECPVLAWLRERLIKRSNSPRPVAA